MGNFEIVPAIAVAYGRVVDAEARAQGSPVASNPLAAARYWIAHGARRIHFEEMGVASGLSTMPALLLGCGRKAVLQVGGGIRDAKTAHLYLSYGASTLVLRKCLTDPPVFSSITAVVDPKRLIMGVDLEEVDDRATFDTLFRGRAAGVTQVLLSGPWYARCVLPYQVAAIRRLQQNGFRVWAAGGLQHPETVRALQKLGLAGVIIGRALHHGALSLDTLSAACQ